jgi:hypothetical protein
MMLTLDEFIDRFGDDTTTNFELREWAEELEIENFQFLMRDELSYYGPQSSPSLEPNRRRYITTLKSDGTCTYRKVPPYKKVSIISNYATSKEGGTHHVALYKDLKHSYYFNSFGTQPFAEAVRFLARTGECVKGTDGTTLSRDYTYSTFQIQKMDQKCCGTLSLYFLYCLDKGKDYYDTIFDMLKWSLAH